MWVCIIQHRLPSVNPSIFVAVPLRQAASFSLLSMTKWSKTRTSLCNTFRTVHLCIHSAACLKRLSTFLYPAELRRVRLSPRFVVRFSSFPVLSPTESSVDSSRPVLWCKLQNSWQMALTKSHDAAVIATFDWPIRKHTVPCSNQSEWQGFLLNYYESQLQLLHCQMAFLDAPAGYFFSTNWYVNVIFLRTYMVA